MWTHSYGNRYLYDDDDDAAADEHGAADTQPLEILYCFEDR